MKMNLFLAGLLCFFLPVNAQDINLNHGDAHLNQWTGTFATKLEGDYSIIVSVDYDLRSMSAVIVDNVTTEVTCIPSPCNYK